MGEDVAIAYDIERDGKDLGQVSRKARKAFREYAEIQGIGSKSGRWYGCVGGMETRLKLAAIMAGDGNRNVVEIGPQRGMTVYALQEYGMDVVPVELDGDLCENSLKKINSNVLQGDAFDLSEIMRHWEKFDAIVSYDVLCEYLGDRKFSDVLDGFMSVADALYVVEPHGFYWGLLMPVTEVCRMTHTSPDLDTGELKRRLEEGFPGYEFSYLGPFYRHFDVRDASDSIVNVYNKIGFKITRRHDKR